MTTRRSVMKTLAALAAFPSFALAAPRPKVIVYKNEACGCCGEWTKHMSAAGFDVQTHLLIDLDPIREKYGVPMPLVSCHTAVVEGYVVEGHVPASDVQRLLRERPRLTGLAVPGMPSDAPGMDQRRGEPYQVVAFDARRTWLFAQH